MTEAALARLRAARAFLPTAAQRCSARLAWLWGRCRSGADSRWCAAHFCAGAVAGRRSGRVERERVRVRGVRKGGQRGWGHTSEPNVQVPIVKESSPNPGMQCKTSAAGRSSYQYSPATHRSAPTLTPRPPPPAPAASCPIVLPPAAPTPYATGRTCSTRASFSGSMLRKFSHSAALAGAIA